MIVVEHEVLVHGVILPILPGNLVFSELVTQIFYECAPCLFDEEILDLATRRGSVNIGDIYSEVETGISTYETSIKEGLYASCESCEVYYKPRKG